MFVYFYIQYTLHFLIRVTLQILLYFEKGRLFYHTTRKSQIIRKKETQKKTYVKWFVTDI